MPLSKTSDARLSEKKKNTRGFLKIAVAFQRFWLLTPVYQVTFAISDLNFVYSGFLANRWGIRRENAPDFVQGWWSLIAVDAVYMPFFS